MGEVVPINSESVTPRMVLDKTKKRLKQTTGLVILELKKDDGGGLLSHSSLNLKELCFLCKVFETEMSIRILESTDGLLDDFQGDEPC